MSSSLQKAKAEALWGLFVADALAMPVHWYYDPNDIKNGYGGWLTGYREPEKQHPSSILTISAVGMNLIIDFFVLKDAHVLGHAWFRPHSFFFL